MHCIHCKTSPATNGQLCSSCILDIASRLKKDSSSIPVVENSTKMTKQKEALMRAKSQLMSKQSTVSPHQLVSKEIEIVKSSSQAPYELAKRKRVSAFTPKQPKKPNAFKPSPAAASKRTVPNTSIPVQCGFHVQVKGRFVSEFSRHPKAQFIESNNPNFHNKLLAELRDKFKGHDLGPYGPFSKTHYPFTHLGTKKSGFNNQKFFMAHLDAHATNKQIDLILDYDDYAKSCAQGEEDESDTSSSDEESLPSINLDTQPMLQTDTTKDATTDCASLSPAPSTKPIFNNPESNVVINQAPCYQIINASLSPNPEITNNCKDRTNNQLLTKQTFDRTECNPNSCHAAACNTMIGQTLHHPVINSNTSNQPIKNNRVDPTNYTLNSTTGRSYTESFKLLLRFFLVLSKLSWKHSYACDVTKVPPMGHKTNLEHIRPLLGLVCPTTRPLQTELGSNPFQNEKVWILKAQLLDTPNIHPMAAKYSLSCNHLPFPIYRMRSYALARQFMALFCQAVSSAPRAASDLKNLSQALRIVDAFPVYLNPDTSEQNQQDTWQADPIGENPLEELRDEPTRGYFMSPAIMQLLSAFQHWICMYTNGQMIITNIQGVVPLLSKPKIIDLNPE
ncbi:hypothetical protein Pst134EA_028121 [Puccinia striiformis f. sp. tritici]|uniref:hypothetical protein n=1 Tax=Puccinia striiformis f. sp. tritici TaxID=168172 RepID=UPI002008CAA4|nr:hypothetical protein Pst134EA_028121 [Puccinia striiformis f. sp. tritici]KAH9448826.1 hypothetical protein Pst134EA_028121 [Puccinia striiformis f. sp. tritici]